MSISFTEHLVVAQGRFLADPELTPTDKLVYIAISTLTLQGSARACTASNSSLAASIGAHADVTRRAISKLVERGYISRGTSKTGQRVLAAKTGHIVLVGDDEKGEGWEKLSQGGRNYPRGGVGEIIPPNNISSERDLKSFYSLGESSPEHDSDHIYVEAIKRMCGMLYSGDKPVLTEQDTPHIVSILKALVEESKAQGSKGYPTHKAQIAVTTYLDQRKQAERLAQKAETASNSRDRSEPIVDTGLDSDSELAKLTEAQVAAKVKGMPYSLQNSIVDRWEGLQRKARFEKNMEDIKKAKDLKPRRRTW